MHVGDPGPVTRVRVRVEGLVQGVGFRPHVHRLATELALAGFVGNDDRGVFLEVEGPGVAVDDFLQRLADEAPPLAAVGHVEVETARRRGERGFSIVSSRHDGRRDVLVPPDVATCPDCLRELRDPADRRHRYPFINCTNCGPRYTIVRDVPYDRPNTTMVDFALCDPCERQYHDPLDRRFHAQPVCCPDCGPSLRLETAVDIGSAGAGTRDADPVRATADLLRAGAVVAIKGLGGFHLAVDATDADATERLRTRKHREDKPFAVMVADTAAARQLCHLSEVETALLTNPSRPIVLLRRRTEASVAGAVAGAVAPDNRRLGVMLPYTPLHHLLVEEMHGPIVLTSGNVSDEPIVHTNAEALDRLAGIADAWLLHDREIHIRVDDSVAHTVAGRPSMLRRSRGYAPRPVTVAEALDRDVLAVGAELKNTVCLAKGRHAFVSHHIGDLENYETFRSFLEAIEHLGRLFDVSPGIIAHDLHPEYLSTKHATEVAATDPTVRLTGVQHHHAHVASCLVDNGREGPVIGLALDGLGYGTDDTLWGGEVLAADLSSFERLGYFETVVMPGGASAIRQPWRMALAHLEAAFGGEVMEDLEVVQRNESRWADVLAVARSGVNSPVTSSAGRLFDAVAALLGLRDTVTFEGQAAIALEQCADPSEEGTYPATLLDGEPFILPASAVVGAVVEDVRAGTIPPVVSARFHNTVARLLVRASERARDSTGLTAVALSGGVFQNVRLLRDTLGGLEAAGFEVFTHRQVPCNDGGISLGQAAIAGARRTDPVLEGRSAVPPT